MSKTEGWIKLTAACLVIAATWLIVLPWIGQREIVQQRIRRNKALGIDPSAMFYTDLEHLSYERGMLRRIAINNDENSIDGARVDSNR